MEQETIQPLPLTGQEVQDAILFKVQESLAHTCNLHFDNSYSAFTAEISIKLVLQDYGREVRDNHKVHVSEIAELTPEQIAEFEQPARAVESNLVMEPAPPNQVRVETNQAVPVTTIVDGKAKTRHVKYAARKVKP